MLKKWVDYLGLIGVVIILSGCGTSIPTNFYLLNDVHSHVVKKSVPVHKAVVGIGPVTFAKYLNQAQIVTRSASNKLNLDEFNHWGEPLKDNFTRVLTQDVQHNLNSHYVAMYPWPLSEKIDYQVLVDVYRFDANSDGKVLCEIRYQVVKPRSAVRLLSHNKTYEDFIGPKFSYSRLAQSMSGIVSRISRDVALDIVEQ